MRNLKKILALALALVMAMSLTTFVSASDFSDDADISYKEAVDVMTAIGVIDGMDDGSFDPNGTLTREQAAALICRMMLGKDGAEKLNTTYAPFDDVAATRWSAPYIAYCVEQGYIVGESTTTFNPTGKLTGHAFAKLLLCVLGYDPIIETYTGASWAVNVATDAVSAGIAVDGMLMGNEISREEAAQMAFQALEADMVRYSSKGTNIELENGVIINTGASDPERVDNAQANDYRGRTDGDVYMQFCEQYFEDLTKTSAGSDDLGRPASEWSYDGDDIGTYAEDADDVMVINPDDGATFANILTNDDYFDLRSADIADTVTYYLNGDEVDSADMGDALQAGDVVEIFENSSHDVDTVVVSQYKLAKIDDVDTDVSDRDARDDVTAYITLENLSGGAVGDGTYNDTDINGYNSATYEENTFLAVALNAKDEIVASYVADTAEGTVTAYKSSSGVAKTVTLSGTTYNIVGSTVLDSATPSSFAFDDSNYIAYLTAEGYVLGIDGTEAVNLDDVYYVYGTYYEESRNGSMTFYAQVVDMDGNESEIVIEPSTFVNTFKKDTAADTFSSVNGLYSFTDDDAKDASGKNANGDTVADGSTVDDVADPKANNDKLSAVKYDTAAASGDYYIESANVKNAVNSGSGSITLTSGTDYSRAYITSSTKFILVEGNSTDADLSVEVRTGSARIKASVPVFVIASKSGNSYEAAVVVAVAADISTGVTNTDAVVYLSGSSSTEVKDGYENTVYFMDGSNETVTTDIAGNEGFYTFEINSDGVYELTSLYVGNAGDTVYGTAGSLGSDFAYDDETGVIPDTTVDSIYNNALITFGDISDNSNDATFEDIALADNLQVVDARPSAVKSISAYTNDIDTLAKLQSAMNRDTVTATAFVDNGEVLLIAVTSMPDARSTDETLASASAVKGVDTGTALTMDAAATVNNSGKTIKVTNVAGADEGDTIIVTAVTNDDAATVSGSVTLTYSSGTWTASGNLQVTAESGKTRTFVVSVEP